MVTNTVSGVVSAYLDESGYAGDLGDFIAWSEFGKWLEGIPLPSIDEVKHLYTYGWSNDLDKLVSQLRTMSGLKPPSNYEVRKLIVMIASAAVDKAEKDSVMSVTLPK